MPPPPGRLVDIGGYRLHIDCEGTGSPVVILEAGLGDMGVSWAQVQPTLARWTQACSYDRAGLGWSDAGPSPRDPARETDELHTLLSRAGVTPPYVLVGHSYGGDLVRLYAHRFPDGVAGLVLVEASNQDQWSKIPEAQGAWSEYLRTCHWDAIRARFGWLRLRHDPIPYYADSVRPIAESFSYGPKEIAATCGEAVAILGQGPGELAVVRSLGELPLMVISAGRSFWRSPEAWAAWQAMQASETTLSSRSVRVIAEHSQHDVQHDEPRVVTTYVGSMLSIVKALQTR
jgi:pimeloyl-ACP methyl ester carboxylesterase